MPLGRGIFLALLLNKSRLAGCLWLAALLLVPLFLPALLLAYGQPLYLSANERHYLEQAKGKVPGEVVFSSRRDGKWRLFRINADGTNLSRLSQGLANYTEPEFIQDGRRLVYLSDENGPRQIFVAQPDLSGPLCLSPHGQEESFAGLSADGLMLVYNPHQGYFLRPLLGGDSVPVMLPPALGSHPGLPSLRLAPDGRRLALEFNSARDFSGPAQLFVLGLDPATGQTAVYSALGEGFLARWSKDSKALVFIRGALNKPRAGSGIWLWEDKGWPQLLSDSQNWNIQAAFALGGPGLVWARAPLYTRDPQSGRYDIWLQQTNGNPLRLTQHSAPDLHPSWRPQVGIAAHQEIDFIYDARQYSTVRGRSVIDHSSPGGSSLESSRQAEAGLLLLTEGEILPAGRYQADFRLKLINPGPAAGLEPILRLAIANDQKIFLESSLGANDFENHEQYMTFSISFQLKQLSTNLNLRLYTLADGVQIRCDCISLRSEVNHPWYSPLLDLWRSWSR